MGMMECVAYRHKLYSKECHHMIKKEQTTNTDTKKLNRDTHAIIHEKEKKQIIGG